MNFSEKLLVIENKIIDVLTMFTWWTEVRFEKDNLYWAVKFSSISTLFFLAFFMTDMPDHLEKKMYTTLLFEAFVVAVGVVGFLVEISNPDLAKEIFKRMNPQGTPNPCRILKKNITVRRIEYIILIVAVCFYFRHKDFSNFSFIAGCLMSLCIEFFIACDSIPPHEKSRRVEKNRAYAVSPNGIPEVS